MMKFFKALCFENIHFLNMMWREFSTLKKDNYVYFVQTQIIKCLFKFEKNDTFEFEGNIDEIEGEMLKHYGPFSLEHTSVLKVLAANA